MHTSQTKPTVLDLFQPCVVELHFWPCFLLSAVSVVILCGIVDDCSDGSVAIVLCSSSSVRELRISDENVCVKRLFVWKGHLLIMSQLILFCTFWWNFNQLVEALWLGCHCVEVPIALPFCFLLFCLWPLACPFLPVARQPGINRVVFRWSEGLCGSPLSS